jgi:hypothetical protein
MGRHVAAICHSEDDLEPGDLVSRRGEVICGKFAMRIVCCVAQCLWADKVAVKRCE